MDSNYFIACLASTWLAGGLSLLCAPREGDPGNIAQLNDPRDYVGGDKKLVVENCFLIHAFVLLYPWALGQVSSVEGFLGIGGCDLLLLALDLVAEGEDEDSPRHPGQHVPTQDGLHGRVHAGIRVSTEDGGGMLGAPPAVG